MTTEAQIRDYIANNLDMIEPELKLIGKEYQLTNKDLTKGFIDILAKDRFGNFVIIELKKSKNPAKSAIHEFHKYVALIKQIYKAQDGKIRCILLSREWKELLIPFSNFVHQTPNYQIEGYQIIEDESGIPESCKKISIVPKKIIDGKVEICPYQVIYLYDSESKKNQAEPVLMNILSEIGSSFIIFSLTYRGSNSNVIYPFGHYLVSLAINEDMYSEVTSRTGIRIDQKMLDSTEWYVEQEILSLIGNQIFSYTSSVENGYSEKFNSALSSHWIIEKVVRFGNEISSPDIYTDEELTTKVKGLEGQHSAVYHVKGSPQYGKRWQEIREEFSSVLIGNKLWKKAIDIYLDEVEIFNYIDNVAITIYNPNNVTFTLIKMVEDNAKYLPILEIAVEEINTRKVKVFLSMLHWNGKIVDQSPEQIIDSIFGSLNNFYLCTHFNEAYFKNETVLLNHGLIYKFAEFYIEDNHIIKMQPISIRKNRISRDDSYMDTILGMNEFVEANRYYLKALGHYIGYFNQDF